MRAIRRRALYRHRLSILGADTELIAIQPRPIHLSRLLNFRKQTLACRIGNPLLRRGKLTKLRQVIRFECVFHKLIESNAGVRA